jgi:hypothetical protein
MSARLPAQGAVSNRGVLDWKRRCGEPAPRYSPTLRVENLHRATAQHSVWRTLTLVPRGVQPAPSFKMSATTATPCFCVRLPPAGPLQQAAGSAHRLYNPHITPVDHLLRGCGGRLCGGHAGSAVARPGLRRLGGCGPSLSYYGVRIDNHSVWGPGTLKRWGRQPGDGKSWDDGASGRFGAWV